MPSATLSIELSVWLVATLLDLGINVSELQLSCDHVLPPLVRVGTNGNETLMVNFTWLNVSNLIPTFSVYDRLNIQDFDSLLRNRLHESTSMLLQSQLCAGLN